MNHFLFSFYTKARLLAGVLFIAFGLSACGGGEEDPPPGNPSVTVNISPSSFSENNGEATVSISLDTAPNGTVLIDVASSDQDEVVNVST